MATSSGLESIPRALGEALAPLRVALMDRALMLAFLEELGWTLDEFTDEHFGSLKEALPLETVEEIVALVKDLSDGGDNSAAIERIIPLVEQVYGDIDALRSFDFSSVALPEQCKSAAFWGELALDLPEHLLLQYLKNRQPVIYAVLLIGGAIVDVPRTGSRTGTAKQELRWNTLFDLLGNPAARVQQEYGWGGELKYATLQQRLYTIGLLLGAPARFRPIAPAIVDGLFHAGHAARAEARALDLPVHSGWIGESGGWMDAGVVLAPMAENTTSATAKITRLYLGSRVRGAPSAAVSLSDEWTLSASGSANVGVAIGPSGIAFAGSASSIDAGLELMGTPASPWVLIGDPRGARLQLAGARAALRLTGTVAKPEVILELGTTGDGLRLVLDFSNADGFLRTLLGGIELDAALGMGLTWSSIDGVTFEGSGTLAIDIPISARIGPLSLMWARVELEPADGGIAVTVGVTGSLALGPISASAENVGLAVRATTATARASRDSFGELSLALAFKPPDGMGLSVDAGVVAGGGYLYFDPEDSQYAGALELDFATLALTAVGLLSTKLPDGGRGWALVAVISAEFPPINIGFGFTLNGVGGILGVNRSVNTAALQRGIKTHTLDSILFPEDVVANAPKILSDLGAVFPVTEGQYVFGPMVKIGWGTPSIITVDLAVIIELPDPIRVVLLGQIAALLPDADAAVIVLHIDVVGIADFESGELSIDASLYDSRLALYALGGDMALRADFIGQPAFALSVGGLNPRYPAPKGFPSLERLSIALDTGGNPRMVLESYFGITSNSVQFGARFWIYAEALGFSVEGETDFNILVIFSPFQFAADMSFAVTVRGFGTTLAAVRLALIVTGPQPWRARGTARFEIAGFKKDFDVDVTLPPKGTPALPEPARVDARVLAALGDVRNWSGAMDNGAAPGVVLRDTRSDQILVHPGGYLEARQKIAPLGVEIECFGAQRISGATRYTVTAVTVGGSSSTAWTEATDYFAPAQFYNMTDQEKLAGPDFETMAAGVSLARDSVLAGTGVVTPLAFDTILLDPELEADRHKMKPFAPRHADVLTLSARGPSARGARARSRAGRYRLRKQRVTVAELRWTIAAAATGKQAPGVASGTTTRAAAALALKRRVKTSPSDARALHLAPAQEVVG